MKPRNNVHRFKDFLNNKLYENIKEIELDGDDYYKSSQHKPECSDSTASELWKLGGLVAWHGDEYYVLGFDGGYIIIGKDKKWVGRMGEYDGNYNDDMILIVDIDELAEQDDVCDDGDYNGNTVMPLEPNLNKRYQEEIRVLKYQIQSVKDEYLTNPSPRWDNDYTRNWAYKTIADMEDKISHLKTIMN